MGGRGDKAFRSVDDVFGEAMPEVPEDERDLRSPDDDADHERWLRDNRPPHHI